MRQCLGLDTVTQALTHPEGTGPHTFLAHPREPSLLCFYPPTPTSHPVGTIHSGLTTDTANVCD